MANTTIVHYRTFLENLGESVPILNAAEVFATVNKEGITNILFPNVKVFIAWTISMIRGVLENIGGIRSFAKWIFQRGDCLPVCSPQLPTLSDVPVCTG